MRIIFEGCDKTGKTTLIEEIYDKLLQPHVIVRFMRPPKCALQSAKQYQTGNAANGLGMLASQSNIIFDRFMGGEYVYAQPMRSYDGTYILGIERFYPEDTILIVLTAPDGIIEERFDGKYIAKRQIPLINRRFIEYYAASPIKNKLLIDTSRPVADCVRDIMAFILNVQQIPNGRQPSAMFEMFQKQGEFQKKLGSELNQAYITEMTLAAIVELSEFVQETAWKSWKKNAVTNKARAREELIDAWHFIINLSIALGMDAWDVYSEFMQKNRENFARQERGY